MQRPTLTFRPLAETDLALLHGWLTEPHVAAWWQPTPTLEELREEYLSAITQGPTSALDAPAGAVVFLACEDDAPFGFIQAYRVMAAQADGWWLDETDPNALGVDLIIGHADKLGKGLGTRMLRAFVDMLFGDPRVTKVQIDPEPENERAVGCYRKVGFRDIGVIDTPDGKALLMKIERSDWAG